MHSCLFVFLPPTLPNAYRSLSSYSLLPAWLLLNSDIDKIEKQSFNELAWYQWSANRVVRRGCKLSANWDHSLKWSGSLRSMLLNSLGSASRLICTSDSWVWIIYIDLQQPLVYVAAGIHSGIVRIKCNVFFLRGGKSTVRRGGALGRRGLSRDYWPWQFRKRSVLISALFLLDTCCAMKRFVLTEVIENAPLITKGARRLK